MRSKLCTATLAVILPCHSVLAQTYQTMTMPTGSTMPAVSQHPVSDPRDTPEDIAKDSARDLADDHFYNKPGATRAQFDADWQQCRLIARGSQTPAGTVSTVYNPAVISPLAAGVAGGLGGAIGAAIAEGQQRRANRRNCLLIRGWRLVQPPQAQSTQLAAMPPERRDAYFNTIVGAANVDGKITQRTRFSMEPDANLKTDASVTTPGSLFMGKKVDPAAPFELKPNEAAIVLAFRRPDPGSAGHGAMLEFSRYDIDKRERQFQPRDWKQIGDNTTYIIDAKSRDKMTSLEVQVIRVTPGDYVISTASLTNIVISDNCFGAPTFHINAGEVLYLGDFVPYVAAVRSDGSKVSGLAFTPHIDDSRATLSVKQTRIADAMRPASWHNRATYSCSAISMDRWDLPGIPDLADPPVSTATRPTAPAAASAGKQLTTTN